MVSPIRVLHVVVNMNRGGAETLIMNLYRNIDREKIQFDFLTCKQGVFDEEIAKLGGIIHRIPYISDVGHFAYMSALKTFFRQHKEYTIVHSHMDKMSGLVLRAARKEGVPIRIAHSHNTQSEGGVATRLYKWLAGNFILSNSTNLLACSELAAKWLFQQKSTNAKLIKNGVDTSIYSFSQSIRRAMRKELSIEDDVFVVGHVGRFAKQKNHSYLLEMFAEFVQEKHNVVLMLVGDGPLKQEIEEKSRLLGVEDKVKFLGIRGDIDKLLQAMDVFVFPSFHEGLPVSLVEAQGTGLTCLVSDQVSLEVDLGAELVTFIPLPNNQEWQKQLHNVYSRKKTRYSSLEALSENGYDIQSTAKEIGKFYASIAR